MKKITTTLTLILIWFMPIGPLVADDSIVNLRESGKAFASVADSVSPSVASIWVEGTASAQAMAPFRSSFDDEFLRRFFGGQFPRRVSSYTAVALHGLKPSILVAFLKPCLGNVALDRLRARLRHPDGERL